MIEGGLQPYHQSDMTLSGGSVSISQPGSLATPQVVEGLNEGKVLASEIGATVTGIDAANFRQYLLELAHAVAAGQLLPAKYAVGMKASGIPPGDGTPLLLAEVLWAVWIEVQAGGNAAAAQTLIADLAKELLKEHLVTKDVLMMNMDGAFLEEVGAVTKAENLRKKEIQLNTRMHYTQRRFNLLREESEGFAKLITALCASTKNTPVDHLVTEVKALIGFFDLDPNRVYDVILDAFEADPRNAALLHLAPLFSPEARTQILGFRFQRLAAAKAAAPEALFNIAAQLIKAKLVPLEGLLPHLAPSDEDAQRAVQEARKKLAEAVNNIGRANLTQAATEKDEASRSKVGLTAGKMELDARLYVADILGPALAANHKFGLAAGLLKVDDWDSASKLLNLLDSQKLDPIAFPPIARALCDLVRKRLEPSFKALYPDGPRGLCILNRKNGGIDVEVAPMEDDTLGLLLRLGAHAYVDVTLLSQLARILKHMFHRTSLLLSSLPTITEGNRRIKLVNLLLLEVLLPALCLVPANVGLVNDIWGILDLMGTTERWLIYNRLKAKEKDDPLLTAAGKLATTEVRKVMRRVHAPDSKDKKERKRLLAPFARLLAKAAHANPLPVCALIVSHVEAYPVMTEPILDAMRYLTPFGYDVLSFTVVHQLGASGRAKLKADGLNISDWLQGLSGFVGQACRRYDKMDTSAICQYIANTLKAAQSYDLLVLKALLSDMTGIMLVSDLSSEQVEALAGGPLLQQEVINLGSPTASAKAISKSSKCLVAALRNDKLAMPLFVMLAQQRRFISTSTDSPHLKLIAELYDKCQETLYLYTEFVSNALPAAEWAELLPPVSELVTQYGVDFEVAFHGHRSLLKDMCPPAVALPDLMPTENGDTTMEEVEDGELEEEKLPVGHALPNGVGNKHEHGEIVPAAEAGPGPGTEIWVRIVEDLRGLHSEEVWKVMSPEFYLTFWSLSYGDIFVPKDRYQREIQKLTDLQNMKKAEERSKKQLLEQARDPRYYRNDNQVDAAEIEDEIVSIKEQLDRLKEVLKSMPEELKAQEANAARVERLLAAARPHWRCERKGMLQAYLQLCILPRVTYSPTDAAFCAKFTQRLHELAVPFFPTILYLDTMMKQLINLVFSCTDREALNLAIFLNETFIMLERWRGNEAVYTRECLPVPGFSTSFTNPDADRTKMKDYRSLCARWQSNVTAGLRAALQSKNYVQIRNALLILNTTIKVFPATQSSARLIKTAVQGVRDTDSSEDDLKTMANMYSVGLENEIRKPGRMLTKEEYEGTSEPPKKLEVAQNGGSRPPTAKPGIGSSKAQMKGPSAREEATSSAGKDGAKGSTAVGKSSAAEAGAATDGQRRKDLRAEAAEFRPSSGENAAAAAKPAGDAKPPRSGAKSGADAKSARSGSVGGKTEAKGREGRGDAKNGMDGKRSSDTGRRRDADKADAAKGADDKAQRPPKRPRTDTAEAAEPTAPPAAKQRINPPVREKPPQAEAAAERPSSLSRQPSSAAPRGSDRAAAAERKPDASSSRHADRDKEDAARSSRSGAVADNKPADADASKRSARGDTAAAAGDERRRAIPVPSAKPAGAETPEPGEVVEAAAAAPAARKRAAADRDEKLPSEPERSRVRTAKKVPDEAATDKKEPAKSGAAEPAEKAREPRESRAGRARTAEQKSEKPEKAAAGGAADGKGSNRSSRDGGVSKDKDKESQAAAPARKDTDQEKPKKAAAEEERGPLPGRLQREHSASDKRSPAARNTAVAWLETARKENQRGVMSRLGLPTVAAAASTAAGGASTPASPTSRRAGKEAREAVAVVEEAEEEGAEGGDDDGEEGDKKSEGKRKKKKKEKSKEKKRHREKGEDGLEEGADDEKSKKDKKKHKKH